MVTATNLKHRSVIRGNGKGTFGIEVGALAALLHEPTSDLYEDDNVHGSRFC